MSNEWDNDTIPEKYKFELMVLLKKAQALEARKVKPQEIKKLPRLAWFATAKDARV
jgi:hypothetical protein